MLLHVTVLIDALGYYACMGFVKLCVVVCSSRIPVIDPAMVPDLGTIDLCCTARWGGRAEAIRAIDGMVVNQ